MDKHTIWEGPGQGEVRVQPIPSNEDVDTRDFSNFTIFTLSTGVGRITRDMPEPLSRLPGFSSKPDLIHKKIRLIVG